MFLGCRLSSFRRWHSFYLCPWRSRSELFFSLCCLSGSSLSGSPSPPLTPGLPQAAAFEAVEAEGYAVPGRSPPPLTLMMRSRWSTSRRVCVVPAGGSGKTWSRSSGGLGLAHLARLGSPVGAGQAASFGSASLNPGRERGLKGHGIAPILSSCCPDMRSRHLVGNKKQ